MKTVTNIAEVRIMKIHEKLLLDASLVGLAALGGLVFLVAPGRARRKDKKPFMYKNFAHRGLHKKDKSVPENSLAAFERASSYGYRAGCPAFKGRQGRRLP